MKFCRIFFAIISIGLSSIAIASDDGDSDSMSSIKDELLSLGYFLGYDISTAPPDNTPPVNSLFNATGEQSLLSAMITAFFSALPVNTTQSDSVNFVPSDSGSATLLNPLANKTFSTYTSESSTSLSANPLVDQQAFQSDPVNQSILNILATPSSTNDPSCSICTGTSCSPLCQMALASNVVGTIPVPTEYYADCYNASLAGQLNVNSLIAPLLYSSTAGAPNATKCDSPTASGTGLQAKNQVDLAANFIRYVSGFSPVTLPSYMDYSTAYTAAQEKDTTGALTANALAQQSAMLQYLASLRVYAAQSSVGISNLYHILSKRLPQQTTTTPATTTSEALSEFQMATWRINAPASTQGTQNTQWVDQINQASPASVQKEIAILLAEINYQLYLNRQEQERLTLTTSMMLLQSRMAPTSTLTLANSTTPTPGDTSDDTGS